MCTHKRLLASEKDFGHVAECDCGTIHVTVGPVSVALNQNALRRLRDLLTSAAERLPASSGSTGFPEEKQEDSSRVH